MLQRLLIGFGLWSGVRQILRREVMRDDAMEVFPAGGGWPWQLDARRFSWKRLRRHGRRPARAWCVQPSVAVGWICMVLMEMVLAWVGSCGDAGEDGLMTRV